MSASPVDRLDAALSGRYRIEREIGQGGMATVYLAEDLRHHRKVALKVLNPELAAVVGTDRFLAEIETSANLQHPNILPLFDSGVADGSPFFVMPYVEGETLRERLDRERQLPVDEAVRIVAEVAEALDHAHRQGVIHRDIKPGNILLREGRPLVADFGIALAVRAAGGKRVTETGLSLGTPQYMSPEQAMGERELDARSDVYSLAATLYEMLAGRPPFEAATQQALMAKILSQEPARVTMERRSVPPNVEAAVHKALAKLPADRFDTASRFALALTDPRAAALASPTSLKGTPTDRVMVRRWHVAVALAVVLLAASTAVLSWIRAGDDAGRDPVRLVVPLPSNERPYVYFWASPVAMSPDGRVLAYTTTRGGTSRLYLRAVGAFEPRAVAETDGAHTPFFSPDGRSVGFLAEGRLWRVSVDGGAPLPVAKADHVRFGAAWGRDGSIYFGGDLGLARAPAAGGTPELVSPLDAAELSRGLPQVLPDGRLLVSVGTREGDRAEILDPTTRESRVVLEPATGARYVPSGHMVYGAAGITQVVAFDLGRAEVASSPVSLPDNVLIGPGGNPLMSFSDEGTFVYVPADVAVEWRLGATGTGSLVRVARDGRETTLWEDWGGNGGGVRLSPDGRSVVDNLPGDPVEPASRVQVWRFDLDRGTSVRLTSAGTNVYPVWAPNGDYVAFSSNRAGRMSLYRVRSDGSGDPEPLVVRDGEQYVSSWSPDVRFLAYHQRYPTTGIDIWLLPMEGDREPRPFLRSPGDDHGLMFSPDGRWAAYVSDVSGRSEVYVLPFPGPGERALVSTAGGASPRWAPDGRGLFYRLGEGLWSVPLQTEPTLDVGTPELLFEGPYAAGYDVDPLGDGFVMYRIDAPEEPSRFNVVQGWFGELERLVPSGR